MTAVSVLKKIYPEFNYKSANKFLYEADFSPPRAGRYLVTVTANGVQGTGAAQFELEVLSSTAINWATIGFAGIVLLFAAVLVVKVRIWAPRRDDIICGHDGALDAVAFSAPQALASLHSIRAVLAVLGPAKRQDRLMCTCYLAGIINPHDHHRISDVSSHKRRSSRPATALDQALA